MTFIAYA